MWIRSQDKTRIKKMRGCRILGSNNGYLVEAFDRTGDIVGIYSTKEKALKVLDMIEIHLQKLRNGDLLMGKLFDQKKYVVTEYMRSSVKEAGFVFQMPQDDEIKENDN